MDSKFVDQAVEGKLVKLGYSFPEKWQKRFFRIVGNEIRYWKKKKEADANKKYHVIPIAPFSEAGIVHTGIERRAGNAVGWSVRSGGVFIYPTIKKQHCFKIESPDKVGALLSRTWYLMAESDQQRDMWVDALKVKIGSLANSDEGRTLIADRFKRAMQEVGMDDHEIKQLYNVQLLDQTKPQENMLNVAGLVMQTAVTVPVGQAGLLVVKVFDNSPATIAGLRVNEDLIMTLNGQPFSVDFKEAERFYTQTTQSALDAQGTLELVVRNRFTYQQRTLTVKPFKGTHPGTNGFMYAHVVGSMPQQQMQYVHVQQPYPQAQPMNAQPVWQAPPPQNGFGTSNTTPRSDDEHEGEVVTDVQQLQQHFALQRKTTLHQLANQLRQFNQY
jgi:hypothetical protein